MPVILYSFKEVRQPCILFRYTQSFIHLTVTLMSVDFFHFLCCGQHPSVTLVVRTCGILQIRRNDSGYAPQPVTPFSRFSWLVFGYVRSGSPPGHNVDPNILKCLENILQLKQQSNGRSKWKDSVRQFKSLRKVW